MSSPKSWEIKEVKVLRQAGWVSLKWEWVMAQGLSLSVRLGPVSSGALGLRALPEEGVVGSRRAGDGPGAVLQRAHALGGWQWVRRAAQRSGPGNGARPLPAVIPKALQHGRGRRKGSGRGAGPARAGGERGCAGRARRGDPHRLGLLHVIQTLHGHS